MMDTFVRIHTTYTTVTPKVNCGFRVRVMRPRGFVSAANGPLWLVLMVGEAACVCRYRESMEHRGAFYGVLL